jgi:hemoglobin
LTATVQNPHYRLLGGEPALRRLVERFYQLMTELPQAQAIRAMHQPDLTEAKNRLFMFLSGWLGGPPLYVERYGQPRLRQAHLPFPIDQQARDAWMDCMQQALAEQVTDGALLAQLKASFFKTADFLRNQ